MPERPDPVAIGLGLLVPLRLWLDLAPVPLLLAQGLTVAAGAACAACAASPATHPLRRPIAALAALVTLGWLRAPAGAASALHLLVPLLWLLASPRADPRWPRWLLAAGVLPVGTSLWLLAAGQPDEHVLHGIPRLHGLYRNLHGHAVAMAALAVVAGHVAVDDPSPRWRAAAAALGAGASVALLFTWVRGPLLFVAIAAITHLALARRRAALLSVLGAAIVAFAAVPRLRDRFTDVARVLVGAAPPEGWGAIGSWRFRIWEESARAFHESGPWWHWLVGRGAGEHVGLHRHLDPHHEWLSLTAQFGAIGLAAWLWLLGAALAATLGAGAPGRLAAALLVPVLATSAVSNDVLHRATLQWLLYGAIGLALAGRGRSD